VFGFWRQSIDRRQSIFCLSNVTDQSLSVSLADINLIDAQEWTDLIGKARYNPGAGEVELMPYQCVWITNIPDCSGRAA